MNRSASNRDVEQAMFVPSPTITATHWSNRYGDDSYQATRTRPH
jgi:hypothetical protein